MSEDGRARGPRRIPIAVAAGLACGVFAGLLVVRQTGEPAHADPGPAGSPDEPAAAPLDAAIELASAGRAIPDAGAPASPPDASADAAPPDAAPARTITLRFDVGPADASRVRIEVDGERVRGREHELTLEGEMRRVKVVVTARGFLSWSRRLRVREDRELDVELERPEPSSDGPGGLIEL